MNNTQVDNFLLFSLLRITTQMDKVTPGPVIMGLTLEGGEK